MAKAAGATLLRGGAYKPRTSPYAFQGLGEDGLKILADMREETGLPFVTEVVDAHDVDLVVVVRRHAAGRHPQHAELRAVAGGRSVRQAGDAQARHAGHHRGVADGGGVHRARGNLDIVLCERGIRTFETATRNTLDISAVPVVQELSHLPVIVDPSHSGGRRDLVVPLARAAIAAGADGIMVDVHPHPEQRAVRRTAGIGRR